VGHSLEVESAMKNKKIDGKLFMPRILVVQFLLIGTFLSRPNGRFLAKVMKISDI
jgi:hypothetical protein